MTHDVYIKNSTGKTLTLNLSTFFTNVEGAGMIRLEDGAEYNGQVECNEAETDLRIRRYCADNSLTYGKAGLWILITIIEPVVE
jgi:hypothetical protein